MVNKDNKSLEFFIAEMYDDIDRFVFVCENTYDGLDNPFDFENSHVKKGNVCVASYMRGPDKRISLTYSYNNSTQCNLLYRSENSALRFYISLSDRAFPKNYVYREDIMNSKVVSRYFSSKDVHLKAAVNMFLDKSGFMDWYRSESFFQ